MRFGQEAHTLDLCLSSDQLQHADGDPILFRRNPPERMPHARLMAMVRALHGAGYQRLICIHGQNRPAYTGTGIYSPVRATGMHGRCGPAGSAPGLITSSTQCWAGVTRRVHRRRN